MICPTCLRAIPETNIVCPTCLENKAWAQIMDRQVEYLARAVAGEIRVKVYQARGGSISHLVLDGISDRSFCRTTLRNTRHSERTEHRFDSIDKNLTCTTCRAALNLLRSRAKASAAGGRS